VPLITTQVALGAVRFVANEISVMFTCRITQKYQPYAKVSFSSLNYTTTFIPNPVRFRRHQYLRHWARGVASAEGRTVIPTFRRTMQTSSCAL